MSPGDANVTSAMRAFCDALASLARETDATCEVMESGLQERKPKEAEEA